MRSSISSRTRLAYLLFCLFLLAATAYLLPQASVLADSVQLIKEAEVTFIIAAIACLAMTYALAAATLTSIAFKPLRYTTTLGVQLASGFAGKLLPSGLGGIALNARYLTKQRHTAVQAGSVMALNGILGFVGHVFILVIGFLFADVLLRQTMFTKTPFFIWLLLLTGVVAVVAALSVSSSVRMRLYAVIKEVKRSARYVWQRPRALLQGFVSAFGVTVFFSTALYLCARSLGLELQPLEVLLVYTACAMGVAIIPTPGGIGGAEAATTASLMALGVDAVLAISIALVFRFVVFWLPILPGLVFFQAALRKKTI